MPGSLLRRLTRELVGPVRRSPAAGAAAAGAAAASAAPVGAAPVGAAAVGGGAGRAVVGGPRSGAALGGAGTALRRGPLLAGLARLPGSGPARLTGSGGGLSRGAAWTAGGGARTPLGPADRWGSSTIAPARSTARPAPTFSLLRSWAGAAVGAAAGLTAGGAASGRARPGPVNAGPAPGQSAAAASADRSPIGAAIGTIRRSLAPTPTTAAPGASAGPMVLAGLPGAITGLAGARALTSIAPAPSAATAPGHRLAGTTGPRIGAGLVHRRLTAPAGQTGRTFGPATAERGPAGGATLSAPPIGTIRRSLAPTPTPTTAAAPGASAGPMVLAGLPSAITGLAGARPLTSIAPAPSAATASGYRFTATATGNRVPARLIRRRLTRPLDGSAQTPGEITATSGTIGGGITARTGYLRGDGRATSGTIGGGIPARAGQLRGDVLGGAGGAAELRRTMAAAHRGAAPLAVTGLPSALTGVVGAHAGLTSIAAAPSAATSAHHRLAGTTGGRMSAGLLRRRETTGSWPAAAPARRGPARGPVAAQVGADRREVPAAAVHPSAPHIRRTVRTGGSPVAASAPAASSRAAVTPTAFTPAAAGPTATALAAYQVPHSLQSLIPTGAAAYRLSSIGSARTIDAARTAAAPGPGAVGPRTAANRSTVPAPGATTQLRRSPVSGPATSTGAPLEATAASLRRRDSHLGSPARQSVERTLGLLLRQAIPPATGITPAAETTIRRMPPSPPVGTPRLGTHRQNAPARGPAVPASADPSWSFAGSGRPDRSASDLRIGSRNRPGGSVTLAGPAVAPDTRPAADRRNSLLDLVPPSLFDRARAGLATASGLAGGTVEPSPVSPSGFAPTSSEVSRMSQPADETVPRRQPIAEALTAREWDELVDVIVDRLEDRVLDELARRGRRFTPGVF